jgi:CheY-like chemotaxis protein
VKLIAKEVLKLLRSTLPATIEIRGNTQSDSLLMADLAQIHQVLMNLCINASHAMQETGGILEVGLADVHLDSEFASKHPDVIPGSFLRLTVSDTGHGMPPDIMDRIFDPFFTTKEKGEGTGLGLAVVHGIVKSLKGTITVYSQPEKGTTFNIFLPVMEREAEREKKTEEPLPTGTERILFVDDEPPLLDLGKKILEPLGYQVEVRSSAVEALELFKTHPERFDLVITDMTMPNMTGDRLSEQLMAVRPDIPVILCTGFSAKMDEKKAKAMGIRAFAFKPILKRDIAVAIRKVLDE